MGSCIGSTIQIRRHLHTRRGQRCGAVVHAPAEVLVEGRGSLDALHGVDIIFRGAGRPRAITDVRLVKDAEAPLNMNIECSMVVTLWTAQSADVLVEGVGGLAPSCPNSP